MDFDLSNLLIIYPVFVFQLVIHEVAHALTAKWGGDTTAARENRLSLNPIVHMDPIGTVLFPIICLSMGSGMFFGWARPVPVNVNALKTRAWDIVVSLAGPFANFLLGIFGALLISFVMRVAIVGGNFGLWEFTPLAHEAVAKFLFIFVALNFFLCLFNLIPVPPLDGSHVVYRLFIAGHAGREAIWDVYRRFSFFIFILLMIASPISGVLGAMVVLATGLTISILGIPL